MLALKVSLNDKQICVAGIDGSGHISSRTTLYRGKASYIRSMINGVITSPEGWFVNWANMDLALGDRITIEIIEVNESDTPKIIRPLDAQVMEKIQEMKRKRSS